LIVAGGCFASFCASAGTPLNKLRKVTVSKRAQEPFAGWEKLDLRSKQIWLGQKDKLAPDSKAVNFIIKTKVPVLKNEKEAFSKAGFKYRSVIKNIVTGSMPVSALKDVAGLGFVEFIEAAVPMHTKGKI